MPGHYTRLHKKSCQFCPDIQTESYVLQQPLSMQFFKLVINDGWRSFAAVRKYATIHGLTLDVNIDAYPT